MNSPPAAEANLEAFDDLWGLGVPATIERAFLELLPRAQALPDPSIALQILSQIALAQALQKRFTDAHQTLDEAEKQLPPEQHLARTRIQLERGRVFQQADNIEEARKFFEQSFELSAKCQFDYHTINAAHMIAIVEKNVDEKIRWNRLAIDLAEKSEDARARLWFGSLINNLGQNYLQAKRFEEALAAFKTALDFRIKEGYVPNIRVARWAVGSALRHLGRLDEALPIQLELLKEYEAIEQSGQFDFPAEMLKMIRGLVHEEMAEIHDATARKYAKLAYEDLSDGDMFQKTEPKRLERLKQMHTDQTGPLFKSI